jgi:hypothetical protein
MRAPTGDRAAAAAGPLANTHNANRGRAGPAA